MFTSSLNPQAAQPEVIGAVLVRGQRIASQPEVIRASLVRGQRIASQIRGDQGHRVGLQSMLRIRPCTHLPDRVLRVLPPDGRRRDFCYFAGTAPSPSLLTHLLKAESGGAAE